MFSYTNICTYIQVIEMANDGGGILYLPITFTGSTEILRGEGVNKQIIQKKVLIVAIYICVYVSMYIFICMYVCIYIDMYISHYNIHRKYRDSEG
jgi:hypothetical protein